MRTLLDAVKKAETGNLLYGFEFDYAGNDFITEVYRSLSVLDGAILVISAKDGVQAQTRILFHALQKMNIPTIIFINKIIAVCGLISTYSDCFICREKYLETSNARRLRK